jgi:hypothetical protein
MEQTITELKRAVNTLNNIYNTFTKEEIAELKRARNKLNGIIKWAELE